MDSQTGPAAKKLKTLKKPTRSSSLSNHDKDKDQTRIFAAWFRTGPATTASLNSKREPCFRERQPDSDPNLICLVLGSR